MIASESWWETHSPGVTDSLVAAAIWALLLVLFWRPLSDRWKKWRHPEQVPRAEFTDEVRQALLNRVRERSSGQLNTLIGLPTGYADLDLEPTVDLVKGWKAGVPVTVTHGGNILEMFNAAEGRLLITGEPGGGKTILLYKLAGHLAQQAAADPSAPLPLVVNLSGWAAGTTFGEWLVGYLCDPIGGYGLRDAGLAARLVDAHRFALLLDGLDEVSDSQRDRCLTAINDYVGSLPSPPSAPVVITCRIADYQALIDDQAPTSWLRLLTAGHVQPLPDATVTSNLRRIAEADPGYAREWTMLRKAITGGLHQHLHIVLANPLLLSLATRSQLDPGHLLDQPDRKTATTYILDSFYRHALVNDIGNYPYEASRRWLGWLAAFTLTNPRGDSTAFYLEDLTTGPSPQWLNLAYGLAFGLAIGVIFGSLYRLLGLAFGLVLGVIMGLAGVESPPTRRTFRSPTWPQVRSALARGLAVGLAMGLVSWLLGGLAVGLLGGLVGLVVVSAPVLEVDSVVVEPGTPDGGMAASRRSWVAETLKWTLCGGLAFGFVFGLAHGMQGLAVGLAFGLPLGLVAGLGNGLNHGGGYVVRQLVERRRLRREGVLPRDPVGFYDWAVDRGVLRRVGGGWQFRHLLLRDLVADQYRSEHPEDPVPADTPSGVRGDGDGHTDAAASHSPRAPI